jgi:hypothetical protein
LNAVATLAVADKIGKAGFQAFAIQKDETKGPQIVGIRDGIPTAVIVCHSACNIDPLSRGIGVQN